MKELIRNQKYSRKEIHDIFSPDTNFTKGTGYWGISGIIKVPGTIRDYIFLVTYGQKQAEHEFDENIDEFGILTWQSQPQQKLNTPQILDFINHDYKKDNIYLFLRTNKKDDYTYLGLLAYVDHDNQREKPVYFKWQILNFDNHENNSSKEVSYNKSNKTNNKDFILRFQDDNRTSYILSKRKGNNTKEFYSNRNINFENNQKNNKELGDKGEDIVVEYEKKMLIKEGREDLAKLVTTTRMIAGNAEKFDIISYDKDGKEKYIEVKTTIGGLNSTFYLSEREVQFSYDYKDKYYLYRVYNFNAKDKIADLKIIKGAIDRNCLEPNNYTCKVGDM